MKKSLRDYFEAVALGNGKLSRFVELVRGLGWGFIAFHFILITAMLNLPVMAAVLRLSPEELWSRLEGPAIALDEEEFNILVHQSGLLPLVLLVSFAIILVLQTVFYLCAAGFLGIHRITRSRFSFRERISLFVLGSTVPVIGSSIFGLVMPTVHIIIFYLAVILLGFHASDIYDKTEKAGQVTAPSLQEDFMKHYTYPGDDLGAVYSPRETTFTVWALDADTIEVLLFSQGYPTPSQAGIREEPLKRASLSMKKQGIWQGTIRGDWKNTYYVYAVTRKGVSKQVVDPYAKAVGVNGYRGMVIDLASTDPPGFREHQRPGFTVPTDAVIYELHVRDLSMHPQSGIRHRGKFLGLTEAGTKNAVNLSTGLDHIRELGVTHIHLLPSFDFKTIDETKPDQQFNWGYDPQNYNVPEGSYSTDPYNGAVRVQEFKTMVQALHDQGLRVVLDVVYNHTYQANNSNFTILAPGYYYRMTPGGEYSNGSDCGNETASEHPMMRKFMVDSVLYWAREYKVDGFRFDLMGLHDIETMNLIRAELDALDPSIITYGEGWIASATPLPERMRALKENAPQLHERIAFFSDDLRDGVKGSVFIAPQPGFVNAGGREDTTSVGSRDEDVKFGIVASIRHPGVNLQRVSYSRSFWAQEPSQVISYVSSHDNLSLWDKLAAANPGADDETLIKQNKLAAAIVLTSQGIPFFQAGEEMARTKRGDENSFKSPDSVNMLDWERKTQFTDLINYYQGLIRLRKQYTAFRLPNASAIQNQLRFLPSAPGIIVYTLDNPSQEDYSSFVLIFNGLTEEGQAAIPEGAWELLVNGESAGSRPLGRISGGMIAVPAKTAFVLGKPR